MSQSFESDLILALRQHAPPLLRWAGAIAKQLRQFNIQLEGKSSGSSNTDALTLADLTVQELLVCGLRDADPIFHKCRVEAEEANGDIGAFDAASPYTIALDPIDGTKYFSERTGNGYAVMLHLRTRDEVLYSLVYAPEMGTQGSWTEAFGRTVKTGNDNPRIPSVAWLRNLPAVTPSSRGDSKKIYLIGFQKNDVARARAVTAAGLEGVAPDEMPGSIYPLLASGEFGGSLIHTPNIYDYPVALHIARALGGQSVWVHNGEPVNFGETWMDERANMLRIPGIAATAVNPKTLKILVDLAKDWSPVRYE